MDGLEVIDQTEELDQIDDVSSADSSADSDASVDSKQQTTDVNESDKVDGRRFNPEWSKALKELRELYPDRADMLTKLRDTYGRYGALTEIAPKGLEDVKAWKTTIDAVGGPEAAAELMQRAATMDQVDERIANADFTVIGELPENLQKGFYQMLPDALTDLQTKDPKAFEAAIAPHFQAALLGTGMGDHLKKMYAAAGDNEPLKELIKQQYDWFQQQTQGAGKMPGGTKSADPQVARLQAELDTRRQADESSFVQGVTDATNKHVSDVFDREAAVYLKQLNLTDAQKSDLAESFNAKLVDKLGNDAAFQKQLAAYKSLKNRSPETVNNYIRGKVDESAKSIIDGLVTARYGGMKRKATSITEGTKTTDNGAVRVAQAPDQSQWDQDKMMAAGYDATVKVGKFYLQGGRTVQLVRQ
jgi:hypothetical protein